MYDVDYDHGETELCVARGRLRRLHEFKEGHVVDYDADGNGSWTEVKVVKHRGRKGRAVEKFGFADTRCFALSATTSLCGSLAQLAVKVLAVHHGRVDAVTLLNLAANAVGVLAVVLAVAALLRIRANVRKRSPLQIVDTGMETWELPDDGKGDAYDDLGESVSYAQIKIDMAGLRDDGGGGGGDGGDDVGLLRDDGGGAPLAPDHQLAQSASGLHTTFAPGGSDDDDDDAADDGREHVTLSASSL